MTVPVLTEHDVFRPGEKVFIQTSNCHSDFNGIIHKHTFIELVYVVSGSATHIVGDREMKVSKGDLFIINYDTPHAFFTSDDNKDSFEAYDLLFTPDFFDISLINDTYFESISSSFLFYSLFPAQQLGPDVHISGSSFNAFGELFNKIYLEFINREPGYINIIRAYVIELTIKIFRKMDSAFSKNPTPQHKQTVDTTLKYLQENYHKHLSLDDLAARVFLSKDYFSKLFRETTGISINAFLQKIRIEEASKLLSNTDQKIENIASLCGFNDTNYFYNTFKKHTGLTPNQYRKSMEKRPN